MPICAVRCRRLLARRARYYDEEAQIFADVLNQGRDAGEFELADALSTVYTLLHATNALLPYNLSTMELGEREEVKERTAAIADLMLHGLLRPKLNAATDPGIT